MRPHDYHMPTTVYVKGLNVRREHLGMTPDFTAKLGPLPSVHVPGRVVEPTEVEIVNARAKTYWTLDPAQKTYYEERLSAADLPLAAETIKSESGLYGIGDDGAKHLGAETVNGYVCDKIVSVETDGDQTTRWHSPKLNFDVRKEVIIKTSQGRVQQTQTEEYRIEERYLPDSLFGVPKGYRKVAAPAIP